MSSASGPPPVTPRSAGTYARRLFHNVYNYSLLGGVTAAALLTGQWWLLAFGAGAEVLWMLYAPGSSVLRRRIDRGLDARDRELLQARRIALVDTLSRAERVRCERLISREAAIRRLAEDNPRFERTLLVGELRRLRQIVDDFVELAATTARFRSYLTQQDFEAIEHQARAYERQVSQAEGQARTLAQKNLDVVLRRQERLREIDAFVQQSGGQLDLIENTLHLLGDQIVSMHSPGELTHRLDELVDGVEAVRQAAGVAEQLRVSVGQEA
ncbi:MAG: hypothetical protein IPL40_09005 [Proteobacteria bacterium]|nr:hypothetical protein [Pseudomonadota bacterium]